MKTTLSLVAFFLLVVTTYSQSRKIDEADYAGAFAFAVSETNQAYPLIFTVTTKFFEKGKIVRTDTEVNENENEGRYRITYSIVEKGRKTITHQLTVGIGNVFCSDDGIKWVSQKYECPREISLYGERDVERVEYSMTEKTVAGKAIKIYRKYTVFSPAPDSGKKEFEDEISTIDSRGFFISVVGTEGTLGPKTISLIREQSWVTPARIKPVTVPKNVISK